MRVLLANSTCKVGGVSTFLLSLRAELIAMGHECELFFFERGSMEPHLPPDVPVQFGSLADLMRRVEHRQIDVVHANNVDWPTGISAVRRLGAKLVLTAHKVRAPAWTYGWNAGNCDALVAVSSWIGQALQPFTDVAIQVVHNGIDTRRFHAVEAPVSSPPIVGWVGRGSAARKRLEAFAAVAPSLSRAGLRIWVIDQQGPEAFAQAHPTSAASLRLVAERWGGLPFDEMPSVYRRIAASGGCVVSTASMEGLPLTLLEAQACGCTVVAADVKGVNECVDRATGGVLYPVETGPDDLTALILATLGDPDALRNRQMAAAGWVRATFSLAEMARHYVDTYTAAPYPALTALSRQRFRHSPVFHWHAYLEERLGVGYAQYEAAQTLAGRGHAPVAAAALLESFATAPTMYAHPKRLAHLLRFGLPRS